MEVKFINIIDYEKWNQFVDESPQGSIYCYSWWMDTVTNGDFKICAVFDKDEIIRAGIVLPYFSKKYIKMPRFSQYAGILFFNPDKQNNIRLQKYLTLQKEYTNLMCDFLDGKWKYLKINCQYNYTYWLPMYWRGFKQTTRYTYTIDYSSYIPEEEFKRFSKGHKWTINKVEKKSDLHVENATVEEYLQESIKTYKRQGIKRGYSNENVIRLDKVLAAHKARVIFKIIDSTNRIHAIEYYAYDHKEAYYILGASDTELRDSGGHTALTWYAIKYFADKVKKFNFSGSALEYVEKNFRNFSAEPTPYFTIYRVPIGLGVLHNIQKFFKDHIK